MKTKKIIATLLISAASVCGFGQLITVNTPNPNPTFNSLVGSMASDAPALYVGPNEANPTPFTKLHWKFDASTGLNFSGAGSWVVGAFSENAADLSFMMIATNVQYFRMATGIDVGFIGNENHDVNELLVNVYSPSDTTAPSQTTSLFTYSDIVVAPSAPGNTIGLTNTGSPVFVEFAHTNQNRSSTAVQSNPLRFNMFQLVTLDVDGNVDSFGSQFIFGINDRDRGFDNDGDDGYFYASGDITPVPEPSVIGAMAVASLLGLLFVRRRIVSKR